MPDSNSAPQNMGVQSNNTFRESKIAELMGERIEQPSAEAAPAGLPAEELESEEAGVTESSEIASPDTEDDSSGVLDDQDAALEDELPADDDQARDESEGIDWKKRHDDLRTHTQELMANRDNELQEHAEAMAEVSRKRFELEDSLTEAIDLAGFMKQSMTGNAESYRNIDWSRIPADKVQEVQQAQQQALAMEQRANAQFEEVQKRVNEARSVQRQREAEIALHRLRRTIPNWEKDGVYGQLREFATSQGMPVEDFNQIANPVVLEWAFSAMQGKKAGSKVTKSVARQAKPPTGRNAQRQTRNEAGQFAKKQVTPNQRGSFADKHQHRIMAEKQGRR